MDTLTLQQIVEFAGGRLLRGDAASRVTALSTDTRAISPGELFVALRGQNFDGHDRLDAAAGAGALGAIVAASAGREHLPSSFALVEVDDTLAAYQRIAAAYRRSLPMKLVGITGSNGKTSTKDMAAAILARRFKVLKTDGNLNNHVGVPRMLLRAGRDVEVAVLEMGMNHPGEIAPLAWMAQPQIAIITNIGRAHLEYMGSREAIAMEKGMLAEAINKDGTVIMNRSDDFAAAIARRTSAHVVMVGASETLHAEEVVQDYAGSRFVLVHGAEKAPVTLPVPGQHMITNALLATAAGQALGISLPECAAALQESRLTGGRLERKTLHGRLFLDDSYNANPDSMIAAVSTLASLPTSGRRIAVLGKMGELGADAAEGYRSVGEQVCTNKIDCLITVGEEARAMTLSAQAAGEVETISVEDTSEAAQRLVENSRPGDLLLVKGSRSAGMERVLTKFIDLLSDNSAAMPQTR